MPKSIDLGPDEYTADLSPEKEVHFRETMERVGGMSTEPPPDMIPPTPPVLPDIKWVTPKIVDGKVQVTSEG
jgi:hypothetical protein